MLKIQNRTLLILIGLSFLSIYPIIPFKLESLSVIFFVLCSLIHSIVSEKNKKYKKTFFTVSILYFVLLISALLSMNMAEGLKMMETMLSLVVFPIIFYLFLGESKLDFSKIKYFFLRSYYVSSLVFSLISFYLFTTYQNPKYLFMDSNFFRMAILDNQYFGDHPIYVSIFISLAIIFGFSFFDVKRKYTWQNFLLLISQINLIVLLFLLMSKGVIIALTFVFIIKLFRCKRIKKSHILAVIFLLSLFFVLIPEKNNRFKEIINLTSYEVLDENNSTSIRVIIYKCGIENVLNNFLMGVGIGDVQEKLDLCYDQKQANFKKGMYNSHNQYLFVWLSTGILGILVFIYFLGYYFKKAMHYDDHLMISVLVLYSVVFLFENVLSRQSGVIFFSFLVNFFLWINLNKKKIHAS